MDFPIRQCDRCFYRIGARHSNQRFLGNELASSGAVARTFFCRRRNIAGMPLVLSLGALALGVLALAFSVSPSAFAADPSMPSDPVAAATPGSTTSQGELDSAPARIFVSQVGAVSAVAYSPDGKTLAIGGSHAAPIELWDLAGQSSEPRRLGDGAVAVFSLAFSPDGRFLATGGRDGAVKLWNAASGQVLLESPGDDNAVAAIAFSPGRRIVASGGVDGTIALWDVIAGEEIRAWTGHRDAVHSLAFAPDGLTLVSAGGDGLMKLWQTATGA